MFLVSNEKILSSCVLIFISNEVADLLVLCLLDCTFIALVAFLKELLLDEINRYKNG
jgi:hypothetical protein